MLNERERAFRLALPVARIADAYTFAISLTPRGTSKGKHLPLDGLFLLDLLGAFMKAGQHMTEKNLMHSDMKLGNVLLDIDEDGEGMTEWLHEDDASRSRGWGVKPVVTDFGFAKPFVSSAFENPEDHVFWGTPGTIPPEQVVDDPTEHVVNDRVIVYLDSVSSKLMVPGTNFQEGVPIDEKSMVFSIAASFFFVSAP